MASQLNAQHPELLPTPAKGDLWAAGEDVVCKVITAWRRCDSAGVVVRWVRGGEGRRALWNYADFVQRFQPLQPDLLGRSRVGH